MARPPESAELAAQLQSIVGSHHFLKEERRTRRYRAGFRTPPGLASAVVRPGSLVEMWKVLLACHRFDANVILQAANTGLTGGSTPLAQGYDREVIIVSTMRIKGIRPILNGRQVICLPGTTLYELERELRPFGREPHSVIGSSCFGASVIGGICNNSGGALVRRGPAYTEMALFARIDESSELCLVNHLGVDLGADPITILSRLEESDFDEDDLADWAGAGSDPDYESHVRDVDADTPARFNTDARRLFEASGSAGKMAVFAVRLDTFETAKSDRSFYIGCNDERALERLRRTILSECSALPISAEYLHRDAFDLADHYGKDQFLLIELIGTDALPSFFSLKARIDGFVSKCRWLPGNIIDRLLHLAGRLWRDHLSARIRNWRAQYEHHLILKTSAEASDEMLSLLARWRGPSSDYFECTVKEARKAFLHRFVIAGAAVRFQTLHPREAQGIVALDVALRRNDERWIEPPPANIAAQLLHCIYYGHFLCHVLHQDFVVAKGADCAEIKASLLRQLDARGARYPAEHNVGHQYAAPAELADFYHSLDPGNRFNPGIGGAPLTRDYS